MKTLSKTAAAALVAGTMGLLAFSPVASAQETTQTQAPAAKPVPGPGFNHRADRQHRRDFADNQRHGNGNQRRGGGIMGRGVLDLVCSPNGAERLEHAFVTISHRVDLTDAQKPAFEALKSTALTAQTDYADTCKAAFDAIKADGKPDPVKGMQTRLAIDTARVEAMTTLLPKFEDFYKALTDEQKASLAPRRHEGLNRGDNNGQHRFGPNGQQRGDRHHGLHPQSTDQVTQPGADDGADVEG